MFSYKKRLQQKGSLGFSVIEVLITTAIVGIVTAIVVIRYGAFNSAVLLRNQAYEVALSIREAQVFSVSIRGNSGEFREPYGIYFADAPTQQYLLFVDADGDGRYDSGEELETFTIDSRFAISDICLGASASIPTDVSALDCGKNDLSVTFERPDFDANMQSTSGFSSAVQGTIVLVPINGADAQRLINIRSTGLISVE